MAPPRRLVCAGEAVLDVTVWIPAFPPRGGDVIADAAALTPGGGFNVMAAAARQGIPVLYAGRHGAGPTGDTIRTALAFEGIDLALGADAGTDSGFVVSMVQPDGERTFITSPAAVLGLDAQGLASLPVVGGEFVYVSGYGLLSAHGAALSAWVASLDGGVTVIADPGPLAGDLPPGPLGDLLRRADWWSCNEREATALTGIADPGGAAVALAGRHARGGVVVRTGAAGCVVVLRSPGGAPQRIMAPAVEVVDTTGAGDTHVGVFVAGLAGGLDPQAAARRATLAASLSVTRRGPATAPGRDEMDRWLRTRPPDGS